MINRYAGELRINPIAILRHGDFNNDGKIHDIDATLRDALDAVTTIHARLEKLKDYLTETKASARIEFFFADAGYIGMNGFTDAELLSLNRKGLIDLFDFATDKSWVKKYGAQVGLVWEDGRAVPG
jgi:hypothetical protein